MNGEPQPPGSLSPSDFADRYDGQFDFLDDPDIETLDDAIEALEECVADMSYVHEYKCIEQTEDVIAEIKEVQEIQEMAEKRKVPSCRRDVNEDLASIGAGNIDELARLAGIQRACLKQSEVHPPVGDVKADNVTLLELELPCPLGVV